MSPKGSQLLRSFTYFEASGLKLRFPAGYYLTKTHTMNINMQHAGIRLPLLATAVITVLTLSSCSILFKEFLINWTNNDIHVRSDRKSFGKLIAVDSVDTFHSFDMTADSALILPPGAILPIGTALNVVDERDFVYDTLLIMRPDHEPLVLDRFASVDWMVYLDQDSLCGMYLIIQD